MGLSVKTVRYVPEPIESHFVPGGKFAVFPVASLPNNTLLWENIRVTWFYAYKQWLPNSDYVADESRIPYEFYLDNENKIFVPIQPKIPSNNRITRHRVVPALRKSPKGAKEAVQK